MTVETYVVGFLFDDPCHRVLLIEKRRPPWQVGWLNGVGGKLEPGESVLEAMRREAKEEAAIEPGWFHFVTLRYPDAVIAFFAARASAWFEVAEAQTDEPLEKLLLRDLRFDPRPIDNLSFLIPMARHHLLFEAMAPGIIHIGRQGDARIIRGNPDIGGASQ